MDKNSEFSVFFVKNEAGSEHAHREIQFLFVVDGRIKVKVQDEAYILKKDDMLIINSNYRHSWILLENSRLFLIHFGYAHLLKFLKTRFLFFYCNSAV